MTERDELKIPTVPNFRGKPTVATLFEELTPNYNVAKIEAWAELVWNAYIELQPLASRALKK